jgi:AraC-like DNA-binding protein
MSHLVASHAFAPVNTWLPPWGLSTCIRAVMWRSARGMALPESQRWSHFPVTPLFSLNLLFEGSAELVDPSEARYEGAPRQRLPLLSVSGPQTCPRTVLYGPETNGVMIIFYPDAWWALTGIAVAGLVDQVVDAREVLPEDLLNACLRLARAGADNDALEMQGFFDDVVPLWQRCTASEDPRAKEHRPQSFTPWMDALALRAAATGWGRSLRQSERRIKQWTGWSMRRLQVSARGEAVFFAVMEALNDGRLDWTQIALDHGFSDQSHFVRETRRLTGFSPEAMRRGVLHEEAFWVYRAWAKLAGL